MNKSKLTGFLSMALMIIAGVILVAFPADVLTTAVKIFGVALVLIGAVGILSVILKENRVGEDMIELVGGIVIAAAGIVFLTRAEFVISIFPFVTGVLIALNGVMNLVDALRVKKLGGTMWKPLFVLSVIAIVLGVIVFVNPFSTVSVIVRVVGVILIYNGIVGVFAKTRA